MRKSIDQMVDEEGEFTTKLENNPIFVIIVNSTLIFLMVFWVGSTTVLIFNSIVG